MADSSRTLKVTIVGDAKGMQKAVSDTGGAVESLNSKLGGVSKAVVGAFAVGGVVAFGKSIYDAATESQRVMKQTEAVLRSTGDASGLTAKQIGDLSTKLSQQTGIDDELIQSGENVLLTFKGIRNEAGAGNDVFTRATKIALDMSTALGTDLTGANIQLGKALNDPIKGITALTRVGVTFTEQQKDQIKTLVESGDTMGAQKIILKELESEFQGSAAAQATAGDKLKVTWGNLEEQLGGALLPAINGVASAASKLIEAFQGLPEGTQNVITKIAVFGTAAGVATLGIAALVSKITSAKAELSAFAVEAPRVATALRGIAAAGSIVAAIDIFGSITKALSPLPTADLNELEQALLQFGRTGRVTGEQADFFGQGLGKLKAAIEGIAAPSTASQFDHFLDDVTSLHGAIRTGAENLPKYRSEIDQLDKGLASLAQKSPQAAAQALDQLRASLGEVNFDRLRPMLNDYNSALAGLKTDSDIASGAQQALKSSLDQTGTAASLTSQAIKGLTDSLHAQFDPLFAAQSAANALTQAQQAAAAATREHGAASDQARLANQQAAQAALNYEASLLTLEAAVKDNKVSIDQATATLQSWVAQGLITKQQADQATAGFKNLKAAADKIPTNITTVVDANVDRARSKFETLVAQINREWRVPYASGKGSSNAGDVLYRASGGPVVKGNPYVVGEDGPELFLPGQNGTIIPTASPKAAMGGWGWKGNPSLPPIVVQLVADGKVLTELVLKDLVSHLSRNGLNGAGLLIPTR
jgi:hypothetical protein